MAGVMLLAMAERRLGIAARLARLVPDAAIRRGVTHTLADMIRARIFAIAMGYEDADDLDHLRRDPAFKLACGRLPDSGAEPLCSQPTLSWLENAPAPARRDPPDLRARRCLDRPPYAKPPRSVTLDIDDTCDVVHGHQQLSLFKRALRRALLSADPRLRHRPEPSGGRGAAPGQDAFGRRGARSPSAPRPAHPHPLAQAPASCSEATATTPGPRRWNGVRPTASTSSSASPDRGPLSAKVEAMADAVRTEARAHRQGRRARLRRDLPQGEVLDPRAPRRRPHRGHGARPRHPLHRHQPALRHGGVALRQPVLREGPGREPDQAAQDSARLGPDLVPLGRWPTRCASCCTPPPTG